MNKTFTRLERGTKKLLKVQEDTEVFDWNNHKIGRVDWVYLGGVSETKENFAQARTLAQRPKRFGAGVVTEAIRELLGSKNEPGEDLQKRLIRYGFIRINGAGVTEQDQLAMAEQIAFVSPERVKLNVPLRDLPS